MDSPDPTVDPPLRTELGETTADRRWDDITGELGEIAGQINALFGRAARLASEVEDENLLAGTGVNSLAQFLGWQLGLSRSRARELARIAKRRDELPAVMALFDDGVLSADQTAPIAARLPADPGADAHFAELAPHLTAAQIRKAVQATIAPDEAAPPTPEPWEPTPSPEDEAAARSPREVTFGFDDDGIWRLHVKAGTADGGAIEPA